MNVLIFVILMTFSGKIPPKFIEVVLSDFNRNSNFISLNISSKEYKGHVVIENNNLFDYLRREKSMSEIQYQEVITKIILTSDTLTIDSTNLGQIGFMKVTADSDIEKLAKQDIEQLINTYFINNGRVIKEGVGRVKTALIISLLFAHEISARRDCETGALILDK